MKYNNDMKTKKLLLIIGILALLFNSCESPTSSRPTYQGPGGGRENGKFYAQDITTGTYYSLYAEKFFEKEDGKCVVWAERGSGITEADAEEVAKAYVQICNKLIPVFSDTYSHEGESLNIMEMADLYGNKDKKLCILLLKIRDGFTDSGSFVAGYFSALDFFAYDPGDYYTWFSNECDMLYIDVKVNKPNNPLSGELFRNIAHEMQHLMNFVTSLEKRSVIINKEIVKINQMDLWIDEGLSGAAEYVYAGHSMNRINWYNANGEGLMKGLIDRGNNFFVWGNRENENPYAVLDDYATVYLFFQWLRLQAGSTDIYKTIISSGSCNYKAVTTAACNKIGSKYDNNWPLLLRDWLAANYINAASGAFGYMGDDKLKTIKTHNAPPPNTSISLAPGEGVYSKTNSQPALSGQGINIKNAYLDKSSQAVHDSTFYWGVALLTYNSNSDIGGLRENGVTTGIASMDIVSDRLLQLPAESSGPQPISAGDMLRRNGHKGLSRIPRSGFPKFSSGMTNNE